MKNTFLVILIIATVTAIEVSEKDVIKAPLDIISLDDITPEERKEIAELEEKINRSKRSGSGSGDILGSIKNAISQSLKKKLGQVAKASASASGSFSRSSSSGKSGSSYEYHHDHPPVEYPHESSDSYDHKSVDWWAIKKSILNTLLQAVKAIKGGVIAVKGQLIKGGGKLISAKGKLLSSKGDAITKLGKNLATSAVLVPHPGHSSSGHSGHDDGGHSGYHYSAPSAPEAIYHSAPSGPGLEHHPGEYYPSHHDEVPHHDGLLILKKLHNGVQHIVEKAKVPAFKPIDHSGPSLGTIVGKFFGASSSFNPHKPELFGNTASGHSYESPKSHHPLKNFISPIASAFVKPAHSGSSGPGAHSNSPFEQTPHYVNHFDDFATSDTKHSPQVADVPKKTKASPNAIKLELLKEMKNKTQTDSTFSLVGNQKPEFQSSDVSNVESANSDKNVLPPAAALNGYSLIEGNQQKFNSKPIDPISLSQYNQLSNQNLFSNLGGSNYQIPDFGAGIDFSLSGPTIGGPTFGSSTFGSPTLKEPSLSGSFGVQTFGESNPQQPTLGGPTVSSQNNGAFNDFNKFSDNPKPISSPSLYLLTPKKNYFLPTPNINNAATYPSKYTPAESYSNDYRQTASKTRKRSPFNKYTASGIPHKLKGQNIEVVESITYQLGPGGPKRLT